MHEIVIDPNDKNKKGIREENLKNNIASKVHTGISMSIPTQGTKQFTEDNNLKKNSEIFFKNPLNLYEYDMKNSENDNEDKLATRVKNLSLIAENAPKLTLEVC